MYIYTKLSVVVRWRAELCLMLYSANLPKNTGMYRNYARCVRTRNALVFVAAALYEVQLACGLAAMAGWASYL
jgi:hypothetical protein